MAHEFLLPDIGEGLTEAEIVSWLIDVGQPVDVDQPLVELETDKAVVEIPSPFGGVVLYHGADAGEIIAVGSILAVIGDQGESWEAASAIASASAPTPGESESEPPLVGTLSEEAETLTRLGAVQALPIVRKLAREHDIDLTTVRGSGPGGRIVRADIEHLIGRNGDTKPDHPPTSVPAASGGDDQTVRLSALRRSIAGHMTQSWSEIPHVTTFDDVRADRLLAGRRALSERHDIRIPIEALIVAAVVPVLREFPDFNATLAGDMLTRHASHHIGLAVDTPDGLLVATLRDAQDKGLLALAAEAGRLLDGASKRKLSPDELGGQTFTVSNIGAVGGGHGTPIVPYGTTAILSVGRAGLQPVVEHDELAIGMLMPLSLSYDHRVIDGGQGRRFMRRLMENLEEPTLFLA